MSTPRALGPFTVPPVGLGCMNLSWAYGPPLPDERSERLLLEALDLGITHFDTAALYGFGVNETLVGRVLKPRRARIVLASKGGMTGEPVGPGGALQRVIDGRPEVLRRHVEASLARLQTDVIDLYYLHRWHKTVPIEESVGAMARMVAEGKLRSIGLSEVSAATLKRAHREHPIAAVQSEYSPWTRNPEIAVLDACREIGAAFVAFSPVARGMLTSSPPDPASLDAKDIRRSMPRFEPAHFARNLGLRERFSAIAQAAGITPAQLAIAWTLAQAPHVIAIPGTTKPEHLRENAAAASMRLEPATVNAVNALFDPAAVSGGRYNAQAQSEVDTEQFACEGGSTRA
jgi:aryl-alcohol dehydrogenase-like predicted oxidoreductase